MKKREKEKEKNTHTHRAGEDPRPMGYPTAEMSAGTHVLLATVTRRNTNLPFFSLGELRKNGTRAEAALLPLRRCRQAAEKGGRERRSVRQKRKKRTPIINPTLRA